MLSVILVGEVKKVIMVLAAKSKTPLTIHHKRRTGAHHRQNKSYAKPYWPYLPLALIVVVGLVANVLWEQHNSNVLGFSTDISATNLLSDTNLQRQDNKELPLAADNQLMTAAQNKADDMVAQNYWSHINPEGKLPWSFITATGYSYAAAGENLAYGFNSSSTLLNAWMNSTAHRANILNNNFTQVGFGIANSSNYQGKGPETVVVAMYAEPAVVVSSVSDVAQVNPQSGVSTVNLLTAPSQQVARVQLISGGASWTVFVVTALGAVAVVWFISRHALAWKRVVVHGEEFVIRHKLLDVLIVIVAVGGYMLTRTSGFIK